MIQSEFMSSQQDALENLRVIRSLMEKAHIYRAISAPAALVGGLLSAAVASFGISSSSGDDPSIVASDFLALWLGVLIISAVINVMLLAREARRRGHSLISDGMKMAIRAIAPPMLVGGVVGISLILKSHSVTAAALAWIICYGLALLATASFSPRSLIRLGWCFVLSGLALFWVWVDKSPLLTSSGDVGTAMKVMGLTFSLLHIGYGLAVLFGRKPEPKIAE
jgi:hypothetical protein